MDMVTKSLGASELAALQARKTAVPAASLEAAPRFVNGKEGREIVVPLQFPVERDGTVIDQVTIRRPVMREWRAYLRACADAVKEHGPNGDELVDQPWLSIPAAVFENLDFVDATRVEAAMEGFFEGSEQSDQPEAQSNS